MPSSDVARSVTVVIPTYKEVESLPYLIDRLAKVREILTIPLDVLIMDDDSRDGSVELIASRPENWIQIIVRTADRGLSAAVLDGLRRARGDLLVCMDADLSHPPEAIPTMLKKLAEGADFVVGSRYTRGGTTSDDWGFIRWLNSRFATLMARPFVNIRDPMSGFFALTRTTFENGRDLNPIGYKIALELIVKCRCERTVEIPIHFEDRRFGKSKLTLKQQLLYLQHLRRLYIYEFGVWSQLMQFLAVGSSGVIVNLTLLTVFVHAHVPLPISVAAAIFVSMCSNFILNRRFTFSFTPRGPWFRQFASFLGASVLGAVVNYALTLATLRHLPSWRPQAASLIGIAAGTAFNFAASRYLIFRTSHIRADAPQK
jgi:dolichol-phosphate mannosyltransferase